MKTLKSVAVNDDGAYSYLRVDNFNAAYMVGTGEWRYSTQNKWRKVVRDRAKAVRQAYARSVEASKLAKLRKAREAALKALESIRPKSKSVERSEETPTVVHLSLAMRIWQYILRVFGLG